MIDLCETFSLLKCVEGDDKFSRCWIIVFLEILVAICMLTVIIIKTCMNLSKLRSQEKENERFLFEREELKSLRGPMGRSYLHRLMSSTYMRGVAGRLSIFQNMSTQSIQEARAKFGEHSPVVRTRRSEANFIKNNGDDSIIYPTKYAAEYDLMDLQPENVIKFLFTSFFQSSSLLSSILCCGSFALLSSAGATGLSLIMYHEKVIEGHSDISTATVFEETIESMSDGVMQLIDGYKFLPIFLVLGYLGFVVKRWRSFMRTCHSIQGRMNDIGMLCGAATDRNPSIKARKKLYKIYRYLTLIHVLCYKDLSPTLKEFIFEKQFRGDQSPDFVTTLQLIDPDETDLLTSMGVIVRNGVHTLVAGEIFEYLDQHVSEKKMRMTSDTMSLKLAEFRTITADLADLPIQDEPNEYVAAMQVLIWLYAFMVILGFPMALLVKIKDPTMSCFQPLALIAVFFTLMSLQIPCILFRGLKNPFESFSGIKADELIANTELSIFNTMRCRFGNDESKNHVYEGKELINNSNVFIKMTATAEQHYDTKE